MSAGGRWLGVIFADRGGEPFELNDDERSAMWTIGKTAALAASVRIATNQQGRARLLQARIDLAREIHEGVVQRLFGISLALGAEHGLSDEARRRCADEMQAALADLRDALERPLAPAAVDTGVTLRGELDRLGGRYKDVPLELDWQPGRGGAGRARADRPVGARRGAPQRRQARGPHAGGRQASDASTAPSCSRCATTARSAARAAPGWGCGSRPWRRSRWAASWSSGPSRAGHWRVRLVVPVRDDGAMSPERNLRVLVVDDHDVVHWGFRLLLTEQPWVERCLTATTVEEALALARRYEPHVALVDLFLGEASGAELCEAIRRESPSTRVLLISGAGWISPQAAKRRRGVGLRLQGLAGRRRGRRPCWRWAAGRRCSRPAPSSPSALLSEREREVLALMASGKTNKEIADQLFLSPHTVKEHTSALYRKLRVRNRTEAVRRAERLGLERLSYTRGRASMRSIQAASRGRPSTERCSIEHVVEGLVVGRLGQGAVPQERVGEAVGGGELAEQVVGAREEVLEHVLPGVHPRRTGGRLVRGRRVPVVERVGDRVRRALPHLVEPLHEHLEPGPPAGVAREQRRVRPGGLEVAQDAPRVGHHRAVVVEHRHEPLAGQLDRLGAVRVVDHHDSTSTPLWASASATRSTLVDQGARTSRTMGATLPAAAAGDNDDW